MSTDERLLCDSPNLRMSSKQFVHVSILLRRSVIHKYIVFNVLIIFHEESPISYMHITHALSPKG
jgi:hypothetical protein